MQQDDKYSGSYYTIHKWMRTDLGLSGKEVDIYAVVYSFSRGGGGSFYGSLSTLGELVGASSRSTLITALTGLVEKGLITKVRSRTERGELWIHYAVVNPVPIQRSAPAQIAVNEGVQSVDTPVQKLDVPVQKLDRGVQKLDRGVQKLDRGVQKLDKGCPKIGHNKEGDNKQDNQRDKEERVQISEANASVDPDGSTPSPHEAVPYSQVQKLYNEICGDKLPKFVRLTDKRRKAIAARWKEEKGLEAFREVFTKAANSDFLKGKNDRGWVADIDFLMKPDGFAKTIEGKYDNHNGGQHHEQPTQPRRHVESQAELEARLRAEGSFDDLPDIYAL